MAQKKRPFDLPLTKTAAAGSNDVVTDPVRSGRLFCIQRVAIENETSPCTDVRLIKGGSAGEIVLEEEDTPQAAVLYWTANPFYLTEGQYLIVRFAGCTASDVLRVYVCGWWATMGEV